MRKNFGGEAIGAQMVWAVDGAAFTAPVTVYITGDAGTQAIGTVGSGVCVHEGHGYHSYVPSAAETNYDLIAFTFVGTGALTATIQVETRGGAILVHDGGGTSGGGPPYTTFQFLVLGAEFLDGSPMFSSRTGSYGIQRVADKSLVVEDGEPLDEDADMWTYTLSDEDADDDTVYRYTIEVIADEVLYFVGPRTTAFVKSACLVIGRYCTSLDIENRYGVEEISKWMGADNEEPIEYAERLANFMAASDAEIDDAFRGSLAVPFTVVPAQINDLSIDIAAMRIYSLREKVDSYDPVTGMVVRRFASIDARIKSQIAKIRGGRIRLAADTNDRTIGVITD